MKRHRSIRIMDLKDDPETLSAYDRAHSIGQTPVEIVEAQCRHGIDEMEIFRIGNRLVMVLDTNEAFDPDGLEGERLTQDVVDRWHMRMIELQRPPFESGEAWPEARRVFRQSDHLSDKDKT